MSSRERIQQLTAQLLRASDALVIQMVAEQLVSAIGAYVAGLQNDYPVIELSPRSDSS